MHGIILSLASVATLGVLGAMKKISSNNLQNSSNGESPVSHKPTRQELQALSAS